MRMTGSRGLARCNCSTTSRHFFFTTIIREIPMQADNHHIETLSCGANNCFLGVGCDLHRTRIVTRPRFTVGQFRRKQELTRAHPGIRDCPAGPRAVPAAAGGSEERPTNLPRLTPVQAVAGVDRLCSRAVRGYSPLKLSAAYLFGGVKKTLETL
jgi:hypothetical protein